MKKLPDGYWTFFELVEEKTIPILSRQPLPPDNLHPVFGLPVPPNLPKPNLPANERWWLRWLQQFSEIDTSVQRLDQSLVFLRYFPAKKSFRVHGISEGDWLRYHVEAYLQEAYILRERLKRFLREVEKAAIASSNRDGILKTRKMMKLVNQALNGISDVRSSHVHRNRFEDPVLQYLDGLILLTKSEKSQQLRRLRKVNYISALQKWRKLLQRNNKKILNLCMDCFDTAREIVARCEAPDH